MAHRTLVSLALGLLALAGACNTPAPVPQEPQEIDFASLATLDRTKLKTCCGPNTAFPLAVGTITLITNGADPVEFTPTGQVQADLVGVDYVDADGNLTDEESAVGIRETYEISVDACPPPTGWKIEVKVTDQQGVNYGVADVLIENECPPADEPPIELVCGIPDQIWVARGRS